MLLDCETIFLSLTSKLTAWKVYRKQLWTPSYLLKTNVVSYHALRLAVAKCIQTQWTELVKRWNSQTNFSSWQPLKAFIMNKYSQVQQPQTTYKYKLSFEHLFIGEFLIAVMTYLSSKDATWWGLW